MVSEGRYLMNVYHLCQSQDPIVLPSVFGKSVFYSSLSFFVPSLFWNSTFVPPGDGLFLQITRRRKSCFNILTCGTKYTESSTRVQIIEERRRQLTHHVFILDVPSSTVTVLSFTPRRLSNPRLCTGSLFSFPLRLPCSEVPRTSYLKRDCSLF